MAIAATTQWAIDAATGNDANGGGFDATSGTPGTNYAWGAGQTAIAYTDLETDGATLTVMCSVGRVFTAADVGNVINVTGGTHAKVGRYQILSVAAGKATVDRSWATEDNTDHNDGAGTLGGSLAGIVAAFFQAATTPMVAGNKVWLFYNAAAYALPSAITAGVDGTAVLPVLFSGCYQVPGDNPTATSGQQPTISHSTYNWTLASYWLFRHCTLVVATTGSIYGLTTSTSCSIEHLKIVHSSTGRGVNISTGTLMRSCEVSGLSGAVGCNVGQAYVMFCYFHDCNCSTGVVNLSIGGGVAAYNVIETQNVGIALGAANGFIVGANTISNCVTGVKAATAYAALLLNNLIGFCGTGFLWTTPTDRNTFLGNNIYSCDTPTSGVATTGSYAPIDGTTADPEFVTAIATGTTATTNAAPGTTFTATGLLAGVTTDDYLCIWSGTGATAGVYAISSVAGAPDSITLATSPGASASAIHWGIVKGGTATDLSLQSTSDCIGAGYGLSLGVGAHVSTPTQGAWETGSAGGGGGDVPTIPVLGGHVTRRV